MNDEFFSSLSLSAQEQAFLQEEILQGKFGQPGNLFLTTRALAETRHVSVVTAHSILNGLCSSGYITLKGKHYYLSHGDILREAEASAKNIGMLVPVYNNEFYASLMDAVTDAAAKRGYKVILMSGSYTAEKEKSALKAMLSMNVSGIINGIPTPAENMELYNKCSVPYVFLGHSLDGLKVSSVQVNSFAVSQKVAQYLIDEGYKKYIYIGTTNNPQSDVRYAAFQMRLNEEGFCLDDEDVLRLSPDSKNGDALLKKRIESITEPTGIFCYHDLLAVKVYNACSKAGKKIPDDVGVIGFDNLSVGSSMYPPLTSVQYRIGTMADMAVNLLLDKIKHSTAPYDNYYIEPNLVIRDSAALAKKASAPKNLTEVV